MSASTIDSDRDEREDSRGVLSGWLDDYIAGRCERTDMHESFLDVCRSNPEAPWDALALLDQYQRRGRIDQALARSLKTEIAQLVFGVANHPDDVEEEEDDDERDEDEVDPPAADADTTGSRWRKLAQARTASPAPPKVDPRPVGDPTLFRRDVDPITRPPPAVLPSIARTSAVNNVVSSAAAGPVAIGSILRERYQLLDIIGRSGASVVYKALDRHRSHLPIATQQVAVKVLDQQVLRAGDYADTIAELSRGAYEAQSLSHPNIARVFDLDRHGDTYFVVMELFDGELLGDTLRALNGHAMPRSRALSILSGIGAALAYAHERNIVHGDLKPASIVLGRGGEVKVLDFGVTLRHPINAALREPSVDGASSSQTAAYASIERVNGDMRDRSDDVYSLACIAYELLSGLHPFGGRSAPLARAHARAPERAAGLNDRQWHVLEVALRWERAERRVSIAQILDTLDGGPGVIIPQRASLQQSLAVPGLTHGRNGFAKFALSTLALGGAIALFIWWRYPEVLPFGDGTASDTPSVRPVDETGAGTDNAPGAASTDTSMPTEEVVQSPIATTASRPQPQAPVATAVAPDAQQVARPDPPAQSAAANGTVEFDKDTYVSTESDGTVRLTVKRTGNLRRAAQFRWSLEPNSALAGDDFAAIGPGFEEIPAGARTVVLTIPLVSDAQVENTELFIAHLNSTEGGPAVGELARAAVIIVDDD